MEQLAAFFLLQRGLYKWGLEYEPKHSKYWKAFRSHFRLVCAYEIPAALIHSGTDSYDRWEFKYKPRLAECVEFVRTIHEKTHYED